MPMGGRPRRPVSATWPAVSYSSAPMMIELRIVTPRPITHRAPMMLFSITASGAMRQPSAIKLPRTEAPSSSEGGRNSGRE